MSVTDDPEGWPGVFRPFKHHVPSDARRLLVGGSLVVFAACNAPCRPLDDRSTGLKWCSICRRHLDLAARLSAGSDHESNSLSAAPDPR
ncbi:MAG: hypothetical protein WBA97_04630 [Actinophytocola sp.]|uniref:hypothetical protein n=1 Tax=Actinophytocola sp. TaxID=1872138 RepID=UPI003C7139D1